ncbi:MAG: LLM class F420-dependent oxidoreductase [SAR202 cluster bacterium]|jgi:probable F420-dependent oxidoreductase|nr:LLM class F420-dependent oxidoreductase [SAR202 cluster bacterium]MDP6514549.1 LLM class F420-dependent oxidoreductase [SAR202 cluster bacterium]
MKFGFIVPHNFGLDDPDDVLTIGKRAEELGFDSVWVNHHILNVGYIFDRLGSKPYYDALTVLTWVAAHTERVRLGTTVLVLPYLNPLVLAKTLATLDVMSKGRLNVGVGVGALRPESDALGSVFETRGRYADESIKIMKELWSSEDPEFDGEFFSFSGVKFSPTPVQKPGPPILVGGASPAALRRVATLGDGWHPMRQSVEDLTQNTQTIRRLAEEAGRDGSEITVTVRTELDVTESLSDDSESPMIGTADQLRATIEQYEELGVDELVLSVSTDDVDRIERTQDRFAEQIIHKPS